MAGLKIPQFLHATKYADKGERGDSNSRHPFNITIRRPNTPKAAAKISAVTTFGISTLSKEPSSQPNLWVNPLEISESFRSPRRDDCE